MALNLFVFGGGPSRWDSKELVGKNDDYNLVDDMSGHGQHVHCKPGCLFDRFGTYIADFSILHLKESFLKNNNDRLMVFHHFYLTSSFEAVITIRGYSQNFEK